MRKFLFLNSSLFIFTVSLGLIFGNKNNFLLRSDTETSSNDHFQAENSTFDRISRKNEILLGGDVMLGRSVMQAMINKGSANYPFLNISDLTRQADLSYVNLENPIIDGCKYAVEGMTFCTDTRFVEGLEYAGIDIVNIANNHIENYGQLGVVTTMRVLAERNIDYTGFGNLVIKDAAGARFGFIGFDLINKSLSASDILLINNADRKVDVLIAAVHWGGEYEPTASSRQNTLARQLIEKGVDVIVGHHPHWVQNIELIDGKPVFYSLGNLVFDQMWSEETKKGILVKLKFDGKIFEGYEVIPIYIRHVGQPEIVKG